MHRLLRGCCQSGKNFVDDVAVDVGEAHVAAAEAEGLAGVIDAENVERFGKQAHRDERNRDRDRARGLHRLASLSTAASEASSIVKSTCIHHRG